MLGQMAVAGKSNEITALPKLLQLLSLQGRVVTADAMHCQRQVAQQVVEQGADYALALKGNQGTLIVLLVLPGVGKTHLAVALANRAIERG